MNNSLFQLFLTNNSPRSARAVFRGLLILTLCFAFLAGSVHSASAYDLTKVKNKSFEKDTDGDGIPNAWAGIGLSAADKRVCNQSHAGSCSFKMVGIGGGGTKFLCQTALYSSGPVGIIATLSALTKAKDLSGGGASWVYMYFQHTDGSTNIVGFLLTSGTSPWTYHEASGAALEAFDFMAICQYTDNFSGKFWVDDVKLTAVAP